MNVSGCVRASLVVLRECAGPAAAYAAGAASVTDERAMLVFVPWGVLLAEDAFVAYERMLRGYGESVVACAPVRGNGCSRLPVVAVEAAAWRSMSKPDVGYVLEGGVAAWLAALEDSGDAVEARWHVDITSPEEGPVLLDLDWDRLIQRDADQLRPAHFAITRRQPGQVIARTFGLARLQPFPEAAQRRHARHLDEGKRRSPCSPLLVKR